MGNSLDKTSAPTDAFAKKSGICGYIMTVEEIINNQLKMSQLYDKLIIDPLEYNGVQSYSLEEKFSATSNFSIINLSKNVTGKENKSGFETICGFLKLDVEEKVLNEVNDVLKDGLRQIQLEIEDLVKNLAGDETTQERKAQLKKFGLALNDWNVKESNNWTSISSQLLEFIQSHTDATAFNKSKYLEAYITALCLYTFAKLRCEQTGSRGPINKQIQNVMDDACNLLHESLENDTYHNAEASFKREQDPYTGIDKLPGCGPADIFCGLHKGLRSATVQKFACEGGKQIISFNNELQENDSFKLGFNKLQVLLPNTFGKHDKENKINVNVDVRIPFRYDLCVSNSDIMRIWDYKREIWQFKSNEHQVHISPLVFKAIYEISAIYAVINGGEEGGIVVEKPCYSKLAKTFERKLFYSLKITSDSDEFTEKQEIWVEKPCYSKLVRT